LTLVTVNLLVSGKAQLKSKIACYVFVEMLDALQCNTIILSSTLTATMWTVMIKYMI